MSSRRYGQKTAGDRFWIWDAGTRSEVMSMYGSPDDDISANVVFSADRKALFVVRKIAGGNMAIDQFVVP